MCCFGLTDSFYYHTDFCHSSIPHEGTFQRGKHTIQAQMTGLVTSLECIKCVGAISGPLYDKLNAQIWKNITWNYIPHAYTLMLIIQHRIPDICLCRNDQQTVYILPESNMNNRVRVQLINSNVIN